MKLAKKTFEIPLSLFDGSPIEWTKHNVMSKQIIWQPMSSVWTSVNRNLIRVKAIGKVTDIKTIRVTVKVFEIEWRTMRWNEAVLIDLLGQMNTLEKQCKIVFLKYRFFILLICVYDTGEV